MKIAFTIESGREQIVLTPETPFEKTMLDKLHDGQRIVSTHKGSFYQCQGGWTRHGGDDESTILVLDPRTAERSEQQEQ